MSFCSSCGQQLPDNASVCYNCGKLMPDLSKAAPASSLKLDDFSDTDEHVNASEDSPAEPEAAQSSPEAAADSQQSQTAPPPQPSTQQDFQQPSTQQDFQQPSIQQDFQQPNAQPNFQQPQPNAAPIGAFQDPKKDPNRPMGVWSFIWSIFVLSLPVFGFIICIVWACGAARNKNRKNLARAWLVLWLVTTIIAFAVLIVAFIFIRPLIEGAIDYVQAFLSDITGNLSDLKNLTDLKDLSGVVDGLQDSEELSDIVNSVQ